MSPSGEERLACHVLGIVTARNESRTIHETTRNITNSFVSVRVISWIVSLPDLRHYQEFCKY